MKKKIAVYANGFSIESLLQALNGIRRYAGKEDFDIFVFLSFATYSPEQGINQGELNIYSLPYMEDFDGIIVLSNHVNSIPTAMKLCREARDKNIPVVSVGMPVDDIPCVTFSNEEGMRAQITHLVEEHGVKRIVFMGGTPDHVDSIARLETTRQVLKEHGLELKDEDIIYGEWGNTIPEITINKFADENNFPDALVCANDIMAMSAMTAVFARGYSVPEDIIITGFDNISYGNHFYPALSTVDSNFEEIGYQCSRLIFDQISGREVPKFYTIPSVFVHAETCGCKDMPEFTKIRKEYCRFSYQHHLDSTSLEMYERVLRSRISETADYSSLKKEMQTHYQRNNTYEGKEFYIVIDPEYFEDVIAKEEELFVNGYKEQMESVVTFKDKKSMSERMTDRHELVPGYTKVDGEQHVYTFCPLHYFQYNYGYMIFKDNPPIMMQDMLYPYLEKLQQSLKLLRINLRLDGLNKDLTRIYNRDPMTGLYNRLAYEDKAAVLYEQSLKDKTSMMVMFVDINYMKRINDRFGHLHGDNAIKTVAESIKSVLKDDWIAVRFGGDEFLLIATDCDEEAAIQVRHNILSYLAVKNHDGSQPYEISASCGYVITDPEKPGSLQDYVKEADNLMYKIKQEVHSRDGLSRY